MFRRKLTWLSIAVAGLIMMTAAPAAESLKIVPGQTALTLNITLSGENDRYFIAGIRQCLISHLEYYFWKNGWEAEIIETEPLPIAAKPDSEIKNTKFVYSAEITGEIHCRRSEAPFLKDSLQWPFEDIEIASRLRLRIRDFANDSLIYEGKPLMTSSRNSWLYFDGLNLDRQPRELPNFVFMRQIENLLAELPAQNYHTKTGDRSLEVEVYAEEFNSELELAFDYASWLFERNYGFTLRIINRNRILLPSGSMDRLGEVFRESLNILPTNDNRLRLIVYRPTNPQEVFVSKYQIQVGLADVGRRLALITALEMPGESYNAFRAMQIGQLLVHEISHLCGAIDVADDNSIMCGYSSWASSGQFDSLNYGIVSTTISRGVRPGPLSEYLALIAEGLESGEYNLVDFPQLFFSFKNLNNHDVISQACRVGLFGRALPYAINGFQDYVLKDLASSRDNFYKCLALLKDNGAVHYYLSLVTSGALADFHAKKSADCGYYPARVGTNAVMRQASR